MRTLVWRGLDEPRMEIAHVESFERARGTQIGLRYELRWELEGDRVRVELIGTGEPRDYVMTFVSFAPFGAAPSEQRYTPLGNRVVRYTSGDFEADIEFDDDGFVVLYEDYLERID